MDKQDKKQPVFLLLDGNAIVHRAYHALPPLTKGDVPVGAVYGFFSMLLKLIQDLNPAFIAVAFDRPKPTFRKEMYVGYQAKRPQMADELSGQITMIHTMLDQSQIPIFEVDGFEADDVIGTISKKVSDQKIEVIIVSGDRDLLQLVNSHVKVLAPIIGITKMILYYGALVEEKYGISSKQFVDYKALVGDSSDNYPGVAGVGPKTAAALIKKYNTLNEIYTHIDIIEKGNKLLAGKLIDGQDQAQLAKKLAEIVTNVPFQFETKNCLFTSSNTQKLKKSFEKYDFNSLLKRLNTISPSKDPQLDLLN